LNDREKEERSRQGHNLAEPHTPMRRSRTQSVPAENTQAISRECDTEIWAQGQAQEQNTIHARRQIASHEHSHRHVDTQWSNHHSKEGGGQRMGLLDLAGTAGPAQISSEAGAERGNNHDTALAVPHISSISHADEAGEAGAGVYAAKMQQHRHGTTIISPRFVANDEALLWKVQHTHTCHARKICG